MRNKRSYKFTDKRQTVGGVVATIFAIMALALLSLGVGISFQANGNAGIMIGLIGLLVIIVSIVGFIMALKSFEEKDRFYFFSWLGSILNAAIFLGMGAITLLGM